MEHNPGGNPAMHPGMQPGMQPAGMGGQVCSCLLSHVIWCKCIASFYLWTKCGCLSAAWFPESSDGGSTQQRDDDHLSNEETANDDADASTRARGSRGL